MRSGMNEMTRLVAAPESFKARFTTAEFERMCESDVFEDWKIELVDGELERMPPPQLRHSALQSVIFLKLAAACGADRVLIEIGIDLGGNTVLGFDVVVLRAPVTAGRGWLRPEDVLLAVEVSETTLSRDLGMKRGKYAAGGIAHYWVIDGPHGVAVVHSGPADGDYVEVNTVRFGEPLAVPGTDATITLS